MEVDGILMDVKGILFPRRCPVCNKTQRFNREKICPDCKLKLVYITEPRCKKCGKQIMKMEQEYCYDCKNKKHVFKSGVAGFSHIGEIKKSIYKIKYDNKREFIDFYTEELMRRYGREICGWKCDALIPVPLHRSRKIKRGYNQAEIIAKKISKLSGIPVYTNVLKRVKKTRPQKELNDIERKKNVENAFKIDKNIVKLRKVILVDDIYTTGSTIDACAKQLVMNGVQEVYFICLSIGTGY